MSEFNVRLRTPDLVAWRFDDDDEMPGWVARTTVMRGDNLALARGADLQVIYKVEWLVMDHDNESIL